MKQENFQKLLLMVSLIGLVAILHNGMVDRLGMECGWILTQWMTTIGGSA
jgi:hypothetical protein